MNETLTTENQSDTTRHAALFALAPNPVFWTLQGEAHLRGFQMCFLRLAGCSVGCPGCDTNYSIDTWESAKEIARLVDCEIPDKTSDRWVWITGGEPADVPQIKMRELLNTLAEKNMRIAVATSGVKPFIPPVDWLSVSPHSDERLAQPYGNEIKLVFGLGNLDPFTFLENNRGIRFMYQYVQPLSEKKSDGTWGENQLSLESCLNFLKHNPNWSLSRQDHHYWNVA